MKKVTTKSLVIETHKANPTFDPSQISEVLKAKKIFVSPSYADQCIRDYKEKAAQLGIDTQAASTLEFEKVDDNPEKTKEVQKAAENAKEETKEKETPKSVKAKLKEPSKEDIENLQKAATTPTGQIVSALMTGNLNKNHIKSIIKIENWILLKYTGYEHDSDTIDLLAEVWEKPLNRFFGKIQEENMLLYIAIGTTIIAHIPVIINLAEKYGLMEKLGLKPKEEKKPDGKKLETAQNAGKP